MNLDEVDILIPEEDIKKRVQEIGKQITEDYPEGDLVIIGVLKGAFIFMADLVRNIDRLVELDFLEVSSYGNALVSSGEVRIVKDIRTPIEGKHVLLVEDILDTGITLQHVVRIMQERHPASIKICCLLDKTARRKVSLYSDYMGYLIQNEFVVGYGLDYAGRYRNYPAVCKMHPETIARIENENK